MTTSQNCPSSGTGLGTLGGRPRARAGRRASLPPACDVHALAASMTALLLAAPARFAPLPSSVLSCALPAFDRAACPAARRLLPSRLPHFPGRSHQFPCSPAWSGERGRRGRGQAVASALGTSNAPLKLAIRGRRRVTRERMGTRCGTKCISPHRKLVTSLRLGHCASHRPPP